MDEALTADRKTGGCPVDHIVMIGNHLPRKCGIATFTYDTAQSLKTRFPDMTVDVWAMNDGVDYAYPSDVTGTIEADDLVSYRLAAREITASDPDYVWIQHEFGIFGGTSGDYLLTLLDRLTCPVAVTLHTILSAPNPDQRRVMERLIARCDPIIVMAEEGRRILERHYDIDPGRVAVVPHGVPDRPYVDPEIAKPRAGLSGSTVAMTFGLLSPGKGLENVIDALPQVVARFPDFIYLVVGATHPHELRRSGEAYRDSLKARADRLGVGDNIRWVDHFLSTEELLDQLEVADLYITPYLNPQQITSGTLAYAVGLGKPVISTPYVHARELLADGVGRLVEFRDTQGFADAIIDLLAHPDELTRLRQRAYAAGREMIWSRVAEKAIEMFTVRRHRPLAASSGDAVVPRRLPHLAIDRLSDSTGIIQHSVFTIPDRSHGYCTDDTARALILMCKATHWPREYRIGRATTFAAFLEHAWNPDGRSFRNFMSYDRRWLEDVGSHDSYGRALWALGATAAEAPTDAIANWAATLFDRAVRHVDAHDSLRTRAFAVLAAHELSHRRPGDPALREIFQLALDMLMRGLADAQRDDWHWFEPVLAYDNARLPEALLRAGHALGRDDAVAAGIATLEWLARAQDGGGFFRAVGSDSFGRHYARPLPYDQQPIEAAATIDACIAAYEITQDSRWIDEGLSAYAWFLGRNDGDAMLGDEATGECFDGLQPTGVNLNQGAESVLAFQLGAVGALRLAAMRDADIGLKAPASAQSVAPIRSAHGQPISPSEMMRSPVPSSL